MSRVFNSGELDGVSSRVPHPIRRVALWVHRYVGLAMAVFLVTAGLTGTLLAFYPELDRALSGELMDVTPPSPGARLLDPFELKARVDEQLPRGQELPTVRLDAEPERALGVWLEVAPKQWEELFIDPYTGKLIGSRDWKVPARTADVMPFIYSLHYSLALGEVGGTLFGIVALLWTIDCFVGAYLTFPRRERSSRSRSRRPWLRRWSFAWLVKTKQLGSFVFTFHRASGLWLWAMSFVFAWSAVAFSLPEAYTPVMATLAGMKPSGHDVLPELEPPYPKLALTLREAHAVGKRLMAEEAKRRGFSIERELHLDYAEDHGAFVYGVESSLDISRKRPRTRVYFDGKGRFMTFDAATGIAPGNTFSSLFTTLHIASIGGRPYQIFVSLFGLVVAGLSVTGVSIWWRKRWRKAGRATLPSNVQLPGHGLEAPPPSPS